MWLGSRRQTHSFWHISKYQRNGIVKTFPVSNREASALIPLIEKAARPDILYYTDGWRAYAALATRGRRSCCCI